MNLRAKECPCGSGLSYSDCCDPFITGARRPETAEQLMRSRYTAYTLADERYLNRTQHVDFRRHSRIESAASVTDSIHWIRLEIIDAQGGAGDTRGMVEFKAWYEQAGRLSALHERSQFIFERGSWLYTTGEIEPAVGPSSAPPKKVGRNDPCPCGSGRKFKKCCGSMTLTDTR